VNTYTIENKVVLNAADLQKKLRAAGYVDATVTSIPGGTPPRVVVNEDDSAPDPTSFVVAYGDPCLLSGASDKPAGPDGIQEAQGDGVDTHTVTIYKKNYAGIVVAGSEVVRVLPDQMIPVNPRMVQLVDGIGRTSVGPSAMSGMIRMEFRDQAGDLVSGYLTVRFL
jgi:hypothetical protein